MQPWGALLRPSRMTIKQIAAGAIIVTVGMAGIGSMLPKHTAQAATTTTTAPTDVNAPAWSPTKAQTFALNMQSLTIITTGKAKAGICTAYDLSRPVAVAGMVAAEKNRPGQPIPTAEITPTLINSWLAANCK